MLRMQPLKRSCFKTSILSTFTNVNISGNVKKGMSAPPKNILAGSNARHYLIVY